MPTVYSSTGTQWPLLQSKTEQKFKSGLFNVSAEFIRPVGNTDLPTEIETSIGPVDVWPQPTVSSGTDGFQRINATGYGVWDSGIQEVITSLSKDFVYATATSQSVIMEGPGCGGYNFPVSLIFGLPPTHPKPVFIETVMIKKIGSSLPSTPVLKIYDYETFNEITNKEYSMQDFGLTVPSIIPEAYNGDFSLKKIPQVVLPQSIKQNKYGEVIELEVVYSFTSPLIVNFGLFTEKYPENLVCV